MSSYTELLSEKNELLQQIELLDKQIVTSLITLFVNELDSRSMIYKIVGNELTFEGNGYKLSCEFFPNQVKVKTTGLVGKPKFVVSPTYFKSFIWNLEKEDFENFIQKNLKPFL